MVDFIKSIIEAGGFDELRNREKVERVMSEGGMVKGQRKELNIDKMRADGWVMCEDRLPDGYVDVLVIATEWVNDNYTKYSTTGDVEPYCIFKAKLLPPQGTYDPKNGIWCLSDGDEASMVSPLMWKPLPKIYYI